MGPDAPPPIDLETFGQSLERAIAGAHSLDEIAAWLASRPGVRSVRLADYILKSNPPQRDFVVDLTMADGPITKIVNLLDLGDQQFQFRTVPCAIDSDLFVRGTWSAGPYDAASCVSEESPGSPRSKE